MLKNLNIFRSILAILILAIPLYPKFPLASVTGTYVAIRVDDYLIASAVGIWFIYQLLKGFPVLKNRTITQLFVVYLAVISVSVINAYLVYQTTPANILLLHLFRRFEYISVFFITLSAINSKKDLFYPYLFLLLTVTGVSAYGYGQKYFHLPVISTMNEEFSKGQLLQMDVWTRINSTFAGHYDLAAFLSYVLVIIAGVYLVTKNRWLKILSLPVFLVGFHILTMTASRISVFAFWGGVVLALVFIRRYLYVIPVSLLVVFSIFTSRDLNQRLLATIPALKVQLHRQTASQISPTPTPTTAPILPPVTPPSTVPGTVQTSTPTPTPTIYRHAPEVFTPIDADIGVARSGEIRFNVEWPRAITAFKKNLLLGAGLGSISLATDNDYLRLLGESGILGFVSFAAIFIFFIYQSLPLILKKNQTPVDKLILVFLGALLAQLANATFIDVFEASKTAYTFWILMGVYYQLLQLKSDSGNV
jgi:hypothetical protein